MWGVRIVRHEYFLSTCVAACAKLARLVQGWSLMLIGPFLDRYVAQEWVFRYNWSTAALVCLAVSCSLAVGVNLSQFACLGRFSAVSYQAPPASM